MSTEVIAVYRQLIGVDGTRVTHLLRLCSDEKVAEEFVALEKAFMNGLSQMHVVEITPEGPRGVSTLPLMLAELGIANIGTRTVKITVHESNLLTPRNGVVTLQ